MRVEYQVNTVVDSTQESDSEASVQPTNLNASRFSNDANGDPPGKEINSMGKLSVSPAKTPAKQGGVSNEKEESDTPLVGEELVDGGAESIEQKPPTPPQTPPPMLTRKRTGNTPIIERKLEYNTERNMRKQKEKKKNTKEVAPQQWMTLTPSLSKRQLRKYSLRRSSTKHQQHLLTTSHYSLHRIQIQLQSHDTICVYHISLPARDPNRDLAQ